MAAKADIVELFEQYRNFRDAAETAIAELEGYVRLQGVYRPSLMRMFMKAVDAEQRRREALDAAKYAIYTAVFTGEDNSHD